MSSSEIHSIIKGHIAANRRNAASSIYDYEDDFLDYPDGLVELALEFGFDESRLTGDPSRDRRTLERFLSDRTRRDRLDDDFIPEDAEFDEYEDEDDFI